MDHDTGLAIVASLRTDSDPKRPAIVDFTELDECADVPTLTFDTGFTPRSLKECQAEHFAGV